MYTLYLKMHLCIYICRIIIIHMIFEYKCTYVHVGVINMQYNISIYNIYTILKHKDLVYPGALFNVLCAYCLGAKVSVQIV